MSVSRSGRFAVVHVELGWSRNDVHLIDVATGDRRTVIEGQEVVTWLGVDDRRDRLVGHTTLDADRGRVVAVPLDRDSLDPSVWQTLVPESEAVIEGTALSREALLVASTRRAVAHLDCHRVDGTWVSRGGAPGDRFARRAGDKPRRGRCGVLVHGVRTPADAVPLDQ